MAPKDVDYEAGSESDYECLECGKTLRATSAPGSCPDCGTSMRNRRMPYE
ncbi:rubrerythrin-like domain-containing protein [Haladaptatus salinisoli]|nr:rubrerythrin-like domain-containing protein [Haladaptatus salinisoli]